MSVIGGVFNENEARISFDDDHLFKKRLVNH